jgi:hypothetical protein
MNNESNSNDLDIKTADYVASAARASLGAVPFAGSLLIELADHIIPNQRIERIIDFAEKLDNRLSDLEEDFIRSQMEDESFNDLLEEGIRQVARSISEERREYIASLITNSLSEEEVSYVESKHLLNLLGELNDIEIIWLRFYLVPTMGGDEEFRERHRNILNIQRATLNSPPEEVDQEAIQDSYKEHLERLGLIIPRYRTDRDTNLPEFDSNGSPQISGYSITRLGDLLLRMIDLSDGSN